MGNSENIPEFIFDLFAEKSFEELTKTEKDEVLKLMTKDEYSASHRVVSDFNSANELQVFDTEVNILTRDKKVDFGKKRAAAIWQIAAAVLIFVGLGIGFSMLRNQPVKESKPLVIEEELEKPEIPIKPMAPKAVKVEPVNPKAVDAQVKIIEQIVVQGKQHIGESLANDNYPDRLVVRI